MSNNDLYIYNNEESIIDVSENISIPINFSDLPISEPINLELNRENEIRNSDDWKLGKKYIKKLNLTPEQSEILDKLWFGNNVFNEIEYCRIQILKQFLRAIEYLEKNCIPFNKAYSTVIIELSEIIVALQYNYRKESLNYRFTYDSVQTEIYNHILKLCENNVREVYGIKRKINTDFNYSSPDILDKFNKKIVSKLDIFLKENQGQILDADSRTNIILNENNTNRWKDKFEIIKEYYSNSIAFEREIFRLTDVNIRNPSVDTIFFEASKFIAEYDKTCSLRLYIHYLEKDLQSPKFDNKQLNKTIQKNLFTTKEQLVDFEKILSQFISDRNLEAAIKNVNELYLPKRKKIVINRKAIEDVQKLDLETSKLLGELLSDDFEDENISIKTEETENQEEITFNIINKNSEPQILKYLEELNLTDIHKEILDLFEKQSFNILQTELEDFIKSKNLFMGSTIDSINDCCFEILDDVLIEEDEDYFTINTDYYKKLLNNDRQY
ncbi:tellurite resistance TerB C-terminal domain-containing protein [Epilithonimonas zeae]|uniref:TerB-C domain-containing protein n=1 Tax=Epilithonimonas zeae TaxID=1416779 RepID=A0A1N6EZU2_9FLAO|nr:tellurite resistance TerB C-terminal domain-containing protein [Epilithonimonas zeae]SIN88534.1 TerB-C domain-containing protein [Epilithonimonas zeae]